MISIQNVMKQYGQHTALKGINLEVRKGEILGFLGPNGAGKTTTMNIITGYISATEGTVKIDGVDILENPLEAKKKIGYLPEIPPLYIDMTVDEYLLFVSKIKKVDKSTRNEQIERILEVVKIKDVRNRIIKNLSKGYKQRVGLAQAIMGSPEVLILDEPTVGLDPKQIIEIRNLITELGKEHTIILSSHILSEVSAVCDRVIIINKGEIVAEGTPSELSKKLSYSNKLSLRIKGSGRQALAIINKISGVENVLEQGNNEPDTVDILVEVKKDMDIREVLFNAFSKAELPILMMKSENLTLEEVFLEVTGQKREEVINANDI